MKYFGKKEKIHTRAGNQEYMANMYVMRCFSVTMIVYLVAFLLNQVEIFIVEKSLMWKGFIPSVFIYLLAQLISRKMSFYNQKTKYFLLF